MSKKWGAIQFIKQGYNLEDIRLLTYEGLRNIVALVHAVFYFLSVELGRNLKLSILLKKIYEKAKRFFQIPPCLLADKVLNNMS